MADKVVIIGSSFGGLDTALRLRGLNKKIEIVVVDREPNFIYHASLHQLVSKKLIKHISLDLAKLYRKHRIKFYNEEVVQVKPLEKSVTTMARKINFDYLVIAVGGVSNYFGIEGMEDNSFNIKSPYQSQKIKRHVLSELEKSKVYSEPINIIVCGGGLTGVETAGELADVVKGRANVIIGEGNSRIIKTFSKEVSDYAEKILNKKGVKIMTEARIKNSSEGRITLDNGTNIYSNTIIWCGGVKPNPLNHKTGLRTSDKGGIMVNEYLQSSHPHIYAVGDCSYLYKKPQPATAQIAIHEATFAAWNIHADISKLDKKAFEKEDYPYLISIGKGKAVMIRKNKIKTGLIPSIIKNFIEWHYLFTRKHWHWPFNRIEFK
ncbi:NAD(P)/FAD-dependent oxidoreductase [Bacteroidota bacterium]